MLQTQKNKVSHLIIVVPLVDSYLLIAVVDTLSIIFMVIQNSQEYGLLHNFENENEIIYVGM